MEELYNPQAVANFYEDIGRGYHHIADNPYLYGLVADERLRTMGYCKVVMRNYLLFYAIEEQEKTARVIRVLYAGRNYDKLL